LLIDLAWPGRTWFYFIADFVSGPLDADVEVRHPTALGE